MGGNALLRRLVRIGVLDETKMKLDYVLGLKVEDFLERRLQTQAFKLGLAKSIHHARVLIRQRHIRVRKQLVNVPSFIVRLDSQKHIDFSLKSPYGGGPPGRVKRMNAKKGKDGDDEDEDKKGNFTDRHDNNQVFMKFRRRVDVENIYHLIGRRDKRLKIVHYLNF